MLKLSLEVVKMWIIFLIIFLLQNCQNLKPENDTLFNLLLTERNIYDMNTLANRRISGQILDMNDLPIQNTKIILNKINKRNIIQKNSVTNINGEFSIDLKIGVADLLLNKNDISGNIILTITNDSVNYNSDKFKIKNLKSVYIYPSGYESPILFGGYQLSKKYYGRYYLNLELINVSNNEMNFNSSNLICKLDGVKINYPYFDNEINKNDVSKKFPGLRLLPNENRTINYYMINFWKYNEKYYDSQSEVRYYISLVNYDLKLDFFDPKTRYFELEINNNNIKNGDQIDFELTINEVNGNTHVLPFKVNFQN
jgi:hypothetical protein